MVAFRSNRSRRGFTYVELLIAVSITGVIMLALMGVINTATETGDSVTSTNDLTQQARFAMNRMVSNSSRSPQLLLPFGDNPFTDYPENIREQTIPASPPLGSSTFASAVLAIRMPRDLDLDQDGVPDADNDGDGLFDEDFPEDIHNDFGSGIYLIDDDGDGGVDDSIEIDDDERLNLEGEDPVNGIDDDGDNRVDEDPSADMNEDGCPGICGVDDDNSGFIDEGSANDDDEDGAEDEDWIDPVVYFLNGNTLVERIPVPWDASGGGLVTGRDFIINNLAENVSRFRVERVAGDSSVELVDLTLELTDPDSGESVSLNTLVRVGGAL